MENTDFRIERVVLAIPTDFVAFQGERYDWTQFHKTVERLKEVGEKTQISAERLNYEWIEEWEAKGVIEKVSVRVSDQYDDSWVDMIKPGKQYGQFMAAWGAFEKVKQEELTSRMKEAKRTRLQRELEDLDKPERAKSFEEIYEAATSVD